LKPGLTGGSIQDPTDPKLEPSRVDEKIGKVMTRPTQRVDPAKPDCNPLIFFLFFY
jgi:hypothetical protein